MSRLVAAPSPNRVRSPTDRQFAYGCSPPRLATTQLPSATEPWHTPTRTFTVLMWRTHRRTHSRRVLSEIQAMPELDPRLKHSAVTDVFEINSHGDVLITPSACSRVVDLLFSLSLWQNRQSPMIRA